MLTFAVLERLAMGAGYLLGVVLAGIAVFAHSGRKAGLEAAARGRAAKEPRR